MARVIKDGKVAVLISYGYGAGWSSWNEPECMYSPEIVNLILTKGKVTSEEMEAIYPDAYVNTDLAIEWIPIGTVFRIHEYDGAETIEYFDKDDFEVA